MQFSFVVTTAKKQEEQHLEADVRTLVRSHAMRHVRRRRLIEYDARPSTETQKMHFNLPVQR